MSTFFKKKLPSSSKFNYPKTYKIGCATITIDKAKKKPYCMSSNSPKSDCKLSEQAEYIVGVALEAHH